MVIVFPIIPWGFLWQRPQQMLTRLGRKGLPVFYLAPTTDRTFSSKSSADHDIFDNLQILSENVFHFSVYTEQPFDLHHDALTEKILEDLSDSICALPETAHADTCIYLVQHPNWTPLVLGLKQKLGGLVIYDCMDDHQGFPHVPKEVLQEEDRLLREADLVLVSSTALLRKGMSHNENCLLLRNGADVDFFSTASPNGKLDDLAGRCIAGYYGSVRDWFDFDLLQYAAEKRPDCSFVIIGESDTADLSRFERTANVRFLPQVPYAELPGYLAYFDVCLIPFRLTSLTLATNPVKFYEYLSAAKPVVSVGLPEIEEYSSVCYLAGSPDEFVASLAKALEEKLSPRAEICERRREIARENSWDKRVDCLFRALQKLRLKALIQGDSASPERVPQGMLSDDALFRLDSSWIAEMSFLGSIYMNLTHRARERREKQWTEHVQDLVKGHQQQLSRLETKREESLAAPHHLKCKTMRRWFSRLK